jgi:hypothetical protein
MKKLVYSVDGELFQIMVPQNSCFDFGENEVLSNESSDISFGQGWYDEGFAELPFLNDMEFQALRAGVECSVKEIIFNSIGRAIDNFKLEEYHRLVDTENNHLKVVARTRDLFSADFIFPVERIIEKLSRIVGFELTDINPLNNERIHIIVRINRPGSNDYNPPHKDIYEGVDHLGFIPPFINFWIPIAGVTNLTNLPIVPKSHLLSECVVSRTRVGANVEGKQYRVRGIECWDGSSALKRSKVKFGEVLVFSSHLIHGLATNCEIDITRVALEFRLFKKLT